ncbi:hypothetical protein E3T50_07005 [Cryobacterium gelidum]|uniref:Smf/DprA SLOG domain-containing protein n=1 Tax=Cryobacterium gelidum TaxID=1259164 RepID=A0A4R9AWD7_9MICO|nr:hypothetical protein E3T50_07005 [Cryobacterium gelidum]
MRYLGACTVSDTRSSAWIRGQKQLVGNVLRTIVSERCSPQNLASDIRQIHKPSLIAAGSTAMLVVEAGWRSGSLNVAGHAAALGCPFGAVPGPVISPSSDGCYRLIKEFKARIITDATDAAAAL